MPKLAGLEVAAEVTRCKLPTRAVILTTFARAGYPRRALDAGASEGMACEGMASAAIASTLGLSEGTVRDHLSDAISKLGAANRAEAARIARDKGWL